VPLTVCPLSNIKLRVFDRMEAHNLKRLLQLGVCVTVNSDDPAYFGGYLLENYLAVQQALDMSKADMALLARNSIEASFLTQAEQRSWSAAIEQVAAADQVPFK
jgi:adenine deaminase